MALAQASFRKQIILNQSQRKARAKYGICAGFWFGSSWAQSQAVGRSIYIYIYIYIANDESPSQHVTVGLAEARPNYRKRGSASYIVREVHSVRERDTEREREREKDGSDVTIVALKLAMSFALLLAKNVHLSKYMKYEV